jgi:hypothetical protein
MQLRGASYSIVVGVTDNGYVVSTQVGNRLPSEMVCQTKEEAAEFAKRFILVVVMNAKSENAT